MALEVRDLRKRFGAVEVLRGVSASFDDGTVTAILGDNGAGKSTLLKTIYGIYPVENGTVRLGDLDISNLAIRERRRQGIEMVFQDLALTRQQSVVANLFMGREEVCRPFGVLRKKKMRAVALQALGKLGITIPSLERPVASLSGGQQQAIAIARALLDDPKVLLLDEPTAALAAGEVSKTLALIRSARQEGKVVVLVTHRLNDVFEVADRVIVMKHGSIFSDRAVTETSPAQVISEIVS
ncbi:MAG: ATP-binding cassette domain-containing protein [Bdellovibrionota bacterium]|nr:MAG: ATP-binding cassette domain-containing protein [Bdellovibrionota bacterium]